MEVLSLIIFFTKRISSDFCEPPEPPKQGINNNDNNQKGSPPCARNLFKNIYGMSFLFLFLTPKYTLQKDIIFLKVDWLLKHTRTHLSNVSA